MRCDSDGNLLEDVQRFFSGPSVSVLRAVLKNRHFPVMLSGFYCIVGGEKKLFFTHFTC